VSPVFLATAHVAPFATTLSAARVPSSLANSWLAQTARGDA
jgi:hypothetical protein